MTSSLHTLREACAAPVPHPESDELRQCGDQVLDWLLTHWSTLPEQPVGLSASRAEMEALLREPPPESGQAFAAVLREFQEKVAAYAFRINHPRFLAFVPSSSTFVSVLGDLLVGGTNFFAGVWMEAAGPAQVELVVLDWLKDFLGYPRTAAGILTHGGSEANLTALLVARERLTYEDRGRAVLYVTEQRHWSIDRAARVVGLHPDQVHPIPTDERYRLQPSGLAHAIARDRAAGRLPWAVVANAGATNTGAVDPLPAIGNICQEYGLWLHVDAAYGWPAVLIPEGRIDLEGIASADSITLDPHKWFAQTFEVGGLLVRDGPRLAQTFALRPDGLQDVEPATDEVNFTDQGLALTRSFRALKVWLSLKVLGVGWFRRLVEHGYRLAKFAAALLESEPAFEILSPRQLSIVCFRYVPAGFRAGNPQDEAALNQLNLALVDELWATGRAFLSSTRLRQRVTLRLCFVNWRTTAADVEEVVQLLKRKGDELAAKRNL